MIKKSEEERRECHRLVNRKSRLKHPNSAAIANAKWRKMHPGANEASCAKWRKTHSDVSKLITAKWFSKHPNYRLSWYAKNKMQLAGRPKAKKCEVCGSSNRICFDHDHKTNKFRGWICNGCNSALGHVKDSLITLYKLAAYLEAHTVLQEINNGRGQKAGAPACIGRGKRKHR